ncbi:MAG: hypothetical protein MUO72_19795 [Bacteroidales bacterium]|nr:hypothetical protein [Bacteroidales bacterium]
MKRIKMLGLIITLMMICLSCEELKDLAGERGIASVPSISTPNPGFLINGDENSYIQFVVNIVSETQPEKTEVVVSHGTNFERMKIAELTSFPATVSITLGEVLDAIGAEMSAINTGDVIYVEVETTLNGKITRSSASLAIPVVCAFDPALAIGEYRAVSATWPADGPVTLTADPADKTALASVCGSYHNYSYAGASPGSFNSCDGKYTMVFTITVDEGGWGNYAFTFTRK